MATPFVGEIKLVPYTFAPAGWAFCDGTILLITDHRALFDAIGTTYGGNGSTTFALPDLRGRAPIGVGTGAGLSAVTLGQTLGAASVTLDFAETAHAHAMSGNSGQRTATTASGAFLVPGDIYAASSTVGVALATSAVGESGGDAPHENMQPYVQLNFVIALDGLSPNT